jgi:hypothetical protein
MSTLSFAWRGPPGSGKRRQLLQFLEKRATKHGVQFKVKESVWYLTKPGNGSADPDEEDEEGGTSKTIPYEESAIHLGFDVARMSMSDKIFLQSILLRWTGQQDVTLLTDEPSEPGLAKRTDALKQLPMRYLVLYHAQYLTDESTLQLQEALEQFSSFAVLFTTELPVCPRLRDMFMEIPVPYREEATVDRLLTNYVTKANLPPTDVWSIYFDQTLDAWSKSWNPGRVQEVRNWIYMCLQRNLRWTDVIRYWIESVYRAPWITPEKRKIIMKAIWRAESGSGWVLVTSYRIPILWESVHLHIARTLYKCRSTP